MNDYNNVLVGFSELIKNEEFRPYEGDLRLGVDLGTANIVVSVVDSNNTPIAGASYPSTVVRDGIVVDFMGASRAVRNMKAKLEDLMGVEFYEAATAIPPGIISGNVKVISNVVESVGLDVVNVIDEPTASRFCSWYYGRSSRGCRWWNNRYQYSQRRKGYLYRR